MKLSILHLGIWGLFATVGFYASMTVTRVFPGVPIFIHVSLGWMTGSVAYYVSNWLDKILKDEDTGIELDYEDMK